MSLSDTKRHEFHIGKILPNEQYIACDIDFVDFTCNMI